MNRNLQVTWLQIRRSPYQALAALMVMFLTFFALSVFALVSFGSIKILRYFEAAPQVIAFFEKGKDVPEEDIAKIKAVLESTGKLAKFKYVSIHEAEAIYREKNKGDPLLLELVNYKILPPSIEIAASSIDALPELKKVLETQSGVKDIAFYEDIVQSLSSWIKNIKIFGMGLISYLLLQSFLVIVTIIGLKILTRKEEIEILGLIGATSWFIRWPFIFEGMFYGLGGAVLGWGAAYLLLLYTTPFLLSWLGEIALLPVSLWLMLLLLASQIMAGMIIGFFGSLLAVHRFLHK